MSRFAPPAAALVLMLAGATATPLAAQSVAVRMAPGRAVAAPAAVPAHHRILTLAWTDITIPTRLDTSASPVPSPGDRYFVLSWTDRAGAPAAPAGPVAAGCTTTVLVTAPCAGQ